MRANHDFIISFLESRRESFIIPVYQRNYDWKQKNCEKLFNDLSNIYEKQLDAYFIGSIVTYPNPKQSEDSRLTERLIIDGQQRITTLFILLIALRDHINENGLEEKEVVESVESIVFNLKSKKLKLKSVKQDDEILSHLIDKRLRPQDTRSNIYFNYDYFRRVLKESPIAPHHILRTLDKLQIVNITLERDIDNPQLIFESLNSTGVDLSGADLIRNFLLMDLPSEKQEQFYFGYWQVIEENTKFRVKELIRHYLTIQTKSIPKKNDKAIYESFKTFLAKSKISKEGFLKELIEYSRYFNWIAFATYPSQKISAALNIFDRLEVGVAYPYFLTVFKALDEQILTEDEVLECLQMIETFVFRRIICEVPTNALNKIFMNLAAEIERVKQHDLNYNEKLRLVLIQKKSSQRLPDDAEFKSNMQTREVYRMKSKNKVYLLEKLENYENTERVDIENLLSDKKISIEHIMPQKLSHNWKQQLGNNYQTVHDRYLHRLGNLTLTGYNSNMSNYSFLKKKEAGFDDSRFYLNKFIANTTEWNEFSMIERGEKLAERALKIWSYPRIDSFYLDTEDTSYFELNDYEHFARRKVKRIEFSGETISIEGGHWRNMYKSVCQKLFELDPQLFISQESNPAFIKLKRKYVSTDKSELSKPMKIAESVYIESNLNTYYFCNNLIELFRVYDWDESELQIYLK